MANALAVDWKKESFSSIWVCAHTVMTIEDTVAEKITEITNKLIRGNTGRRHSIQNIKSSPKSIRHYTMQNGEKRTLKNIGVPKEDGGMHIRKRTGSVTDDEPNGSSSSEEAKQLVHSIQMSASCKHCKKSEKGTWSSHRDALDFDLSDGTA